MTSASTGPGICPLCEEQGAIGSACQRSPICQRRELHLIPLEHFEQLRDTKPNDRPAYIGELVDDYLLVGLLGEGGFGQVYLALQLPLLMPAALKLLSRSATEGMGRDLSESKFRAEALSLSRLNHPNIVRLLKYGIKAGRPYMVMELVGGGHSLARELKRLHERDVPAELPFVRHVLGQVLNALACAHEAQIVHRDVKPDNIMLQPVAGDEHFVRVLDFGLAKFISEGTETSMVMGTPMYMAPEQLARRNIGPWTDLYAVGVIAFELLTGAQPFVGTSFHELAAAKLDPAHDPALHVGEARFPAFAKPFFAKAFQHDPAQRFQHADELRGALFALLDEWQRALESGTALRPSPAAEEALEQPTTARDTPPAKTEAPRTLAPGPIAAASSRSSQATLEVDETADDSHNGAARRRENGEAALTASSLVPASAGRRLALLVTLFVVAFVLVLVAMWAFDRRRARGDEPRHDETETRQTRGRPDVAEHPPTSPERPGVIVLRPGDPRRDPSNTRGKVVIEILPSPPPGPKNPGDPKSPADAKSPGGPKRPGDPRRSPSDPKHGPSDPKHAPRPGVTLVAPKPQRPPISGPKTACREALGPTHHLDDAKVPLNPLRDHAAAGRECPKACDASDGFACWVVGRLYDLGLGLPRDAGKAAFYYRKACKLNNGRGCRFAAYHAAGGKRTTVWNLMLRACVRGDGAGCAELGMMYEEGRGFPAKDLSIAKSNYESACDLNYAVGCARLAQLHLLGSGTPRNPKRAKELYQKACTLGHLPSCSAAKNL